MNRLTILYLSNSIEVAFFFQLTYAETTNIYFSLRKTSATKR